MNSVLAVEHGCNQIDVVTQKKNFCLRFLFYLNKLKTTIDTKSSMISAGDEIPMCDVCKIRILLVKQLKIRIYEIKLYSYIRCDIERDRETPDLHTVRMKGLRICTFRSCINIGLFTGFDWNKNFSIGKKNQQRTLKHRRR